MSKSMALNFLLFQAGWFACVLGGAYDYALPGSLIAIMVIAFHCYRAADATNELRLLLLAFVIGFVFESIVTSQGLAQYQHGQLINDIAPYWMILMWPLFATTLNLSMHWLKSLNLLLTALAGAIFAPMAYFAGNRLGAVEYDNPVISLGLIAAGWAILLPAMVKLSLKFNGYPASPVKTLTTEAA
ncbi:MAG: DUF2878 domain-containing protein [Gammaproteobacteria bacterium]|nr:DUF2878 domain-containing protein [Gammaproteobacteria bacterium]